MLRIAQRWDGYCSPPRLLRWDRRSCLSAFSLVELLLVLGIITVLISILLPVVYRIRLAARVADTKNQIRNIEQAVNQYFNDLRSYPGPVGADEVIAGTGQCKADAENLVLGLLGGLNVGGTFDASMVGRGPISQGTEKRRLDPFLSLAAGSEQISAGRFVDQGGVSANDSNVPEFIDRFNPPLPILYLRARKGGPGIIGSGNRQQYDIGQITAYTAVNLGGRTHGLTQVGNPGDTFSATGINQGHAYFTNPALSGVPRQKDGYILISAGADRIFGTRDDVCSFGSLD